MASTGTSGPTATERRRVEAVVETLAAIHHHGESLGELAHDARNMVTALGLYCDLLEEPGVLAPVHEHYAHELRLLTEASRCLVEKLSLLGSGEWEASGGATAPSQGRLFLETSELYAEKNGVQSMSAGLIENFGEELRACEGLLAAIPGPAVTVTVQAEDGTLPIRMSGENLIRALVNLVKNSAESIRGAGSIVLRLGEQRNEEGAVRSLVLSLEDTGAGIPAHLLDKVFESGFSTRAGEHSDTGWLTGHRGMGLSITRSIVEAAGGNIHAENCSPQGSRFVIELPVRDA